MRSLPDDITRLLRAGRGVFSVAEARLRGITRPRLTRLAQAGLLVRLARGVYACASTYRDADEWAAFGLRSRAFTLACGTRAFAAGWSAAALYGLPPINAPPARPVVCLADGAGSAVNSRYGTVRVAALPPNQCRYQDRCRLTSLPRTVVDVARVAPRADAIVVADAALSSGVTVADLRGVLGVQSGWRGSREAAWVIEHADAYAESALESLGRLAFIAHDLPVPMSNAWIDTGERRYRVDHLLPDRWLVFEADGSLKYDNRLDAGRVVADQREREWRLRELGLEVVRYGWEQARHDRKRLAARFAAAIERCPVRPEPVQWTRGAGPGSRLMV
ncbi:type IV toxin-antitoxin system AbiEi family antitoxin domain-containing protein [Jiangella alkaliphila]|uniref:Transcriptional regulator, AbiEi antitoxin, Type IV TA system n=1 Tax=Jiangella alkaliphila TaxID=419479 RepID=A0A1H2L0Z3_9ACTN|nr:type IV toxin-antitoxin system AbiEi family antitoxin domain-containing protein [Jiangella alkaliphila]SDU74216.1 Transcriptional regulator, AbiEi antitoxin, Type IV TA system [Jiangella alkaliphila]